MEAHITQRTDTSVEITHPDGLVVEMEVTARAHVTQRTDTTVEITHPDGLVVEMEVTARACA